MREGLKYGPSALSRPLSHPVGQFIIQNALKGGLAAAGGARVWKALKALGII
jgi:hypothetical protein